VARTGLDQWPLTRLVEIELRDLGQGGNIGWKEPAVLPLDEPPPRQARLIQLVVGIFVLMYLGLGYVRLNL
jgi:hypothetical protein